MQLALVAVALRGRDAPIRLSWPRFDARLRKLLAAVALTVAASSALPLFVIVGTQAASFTPSAVSWLYFADRLMQLPFGIVASVVGVVLLPELARHHAAGRDAALVSAQNRALEIACLVAAPAAIGLGLCAETIVAVLFERGAFGADDTARHRPRPAGLSLGLPFAVAGKVLAQTLFARSAFAPQIRAIAAGLVATAAAALLSPERSGGLSLGLAVAAGCIAYAAGLAYALSGAGLWRPDAALARRLVRVAAAAAALAAALLGLRALALPANLATLLLSCAGGAAVYAGSAVAVGAVGRADLGLLAKNR